MSLSEAQSASEVIFRARAYSPNLFSPVLMIMMNETIGGNRPPGDNQDSQSDEMTSKKTIEMQKAICFK